VNYGSIRGDACARAAVRRQLRYVACGGVSSDLIVRPFQWEGSVATIRDSNRDAANNEIGMQAVEFVGDDVDGDGDGVVNE